MPNDISITVERSAEIKIADHDWDELLERSRFDTVFLRSPFLHAALKGYGEGCDVITVRVFASDKVLIGAALFLQHGHHGELLGTGPSDYLDLPVDASLSVETASSIQRRMIEELFHQSPTIKSLALNHLIEGRGTPAVLKSGLPGLYLTTLRTMPAPTIEKQTIVELANKSSIRRPDNRLARMGKVTCEHFIRAEEILPRLEPFFEQHVARWNGTDSPSMFNDPVHRKFYRQLTEELSSTGWLRYTEIRLDDTLAAAHYGFCQGGRFIWYKPTYNPAMAELSPGIVLIRRLLLLALEEGVKEFDFTIGDEEFKSRYATHERTVHDLHLTRSMSETIMLRGKMKLRRAARIGLEQLKLIKPRPKRSPLPAVIEKESKPT